MEAGKNTLLGASTSTNTAASADAGPGPMNASSPNGATAPANHTGAAIPAKRSLPSEPLEDEQMWCDKCKHVRLKSDFLRRTAMGRPEYFKQCESCRDKKRRSSAALKARREKEEQEMNEDESQQLQTPKNKGGKSRQKAKAKREKQNQQKTGLQMPEHQHHEPQNYGQQHHVQHGPGQQHHEPQNYGKHHHAQQGSSQLRFKSQDYGQQDHILQNYIQHHRGQQHRGQKHHGQQHHGQQHRGQQHHGQQKVPDDGMDEAPSTAYSTSHPTPQTGSHSPPATDVSSPMSSAADSVAQTQSPTNIGNMELEDDIAYYNNEFDGSCRSPSTLLTTECEVPDDTAASHSSPASKDCPQSQPDGSLIVSETRSPGLTVPHTGQSDADADPAPGFLGDLSISPTPPQTASQITGDLRLTTEHFEITQTVAMKTPLPHDEVKNRIAYERRIFEGAVNTCSYLRRQSSESLDHIWRKRRAAVLLDLVVVPLPEPQPMFGTTYKKGSHTNIFNAYPNGAPGS